MRWAGSACSRTLRRWRCLGCVWALLDCRRFVLHALPHHRHHHHYYYQFLYGTTTHHIKTATSIHYRFRSLPYEPLCGYCSYGVWPIATIFVPKETIWHYLRCSFSSSRSSVLIFSRLSRPLQLRRLLAPPLDIANLPYDRYCHIIRISKVTNHSFTAVQFVLPPGKAVPFERPPLHLHRLLQVGQNDFFG